MAITPWSWDKSNGTASATQTKNAYKALTTKGSTSSFSHYVWNDLVAKINETAVALGRGWSNEILSYSATRMFWFYSPLSAKMFNSARLNTNYRVWSWSTDETQPGYIGRENFNGVDDVGEKDADFVYRKDMGGTFGCIISAFGDINFVDISAWEHPVQTETDLYISQVAFANSYEKNWRCGNAGHFTQKRNRHTRPVL